MVQNSLVFIPVVMKIAFSIHYYFQEAFKMKSNHSIAILMLTLLIVSSGFASTIGNWYGAPTGDANKPAGAGKWKDAYWNNPPVAIPAAPATTSDEIKIVRQGTSCTIDSNAGSYICKLSIGGGTNLSNAAAVEITNGGFLGIGECRVGSGGAAKTGAVGLLSQTGGTICLNHKLFVGRYGTSDENLNEGKGFYSISGGLLTYSPSNVEGGLYVGAAGSGGKSEGVFTVIGKQAKITLRKLYVGGDGKKSEGIGTLEFELEPNGVSPIQISNGVFLDQMAENSTANLKINAVYGAPKKDVMLVETQGTSAVAGVFDAVNGQAAAEGANVVLQTADGVYSYKLTYAGGNGNDIVLKYVKFEPKTAVKEPNTAK
jgi:hypothetical protein